MIPHGRKFPKQLGKYELLDRIGDGGMAEIYRARLPGVAGFQKIVVIKRMLPHLAGERKYQKMFVQEASLAAIVQHPHVVQVHALEQTDDGEFFMVMEYVRGTDLRRILASATKKGLRLPPWFSVYAISKVLDALSYAHNLIDDAGRQRTILHRDVTPSNVFVSQLGEIKLGDFGVAREQAKSNGRKPQKGELKGKVAYMAPEQLYLKPLDQRADIFSVAVILWECLTQRRLFGGRPEIEVMNLICKNARKPPSTYADDIPKELDEVVLEGLTISRRERIQTARAFLTRLLDVLQTLRPNVRQEHVRDVVEQLSTGPRPAFVEDSKSPVHMFSGPATGSLSRTPPPRFDKSASDSVGPSAGGWTGDFWINPDAAATSEAALAFTPAPEETADFISGLERFPDISESRGPTSDLMAQGLAQPLPPTTEQTLGSLDIPVLDVGDELETGDITSDDVEVVQEEARAGPLEPLAPREPPKRPPRRETFDPGFVSGIVEIGSAPTRSHHSFVPRAAPRKSRTKEPPGDAFWIRLPSAPDTGPLPFSELRMILTSNTDSALRVSGDGYSFHDRDTFVHLVEGDVPAPDRRVVRESGTLADSAIFSLLGRLERQRWWGTLFLLGESETSRVALHFLDGAPTGVETVRGWLRLFGGLVDQGVITEEDRAVMAQLALRESRSVAEVAMLRPALDLKSAMRELLEESLLDVSRWHGGEFALTERGEDKLGTQPIVRSTAGLLVKIISNLYSMDDVRLALRDFLVTTFTKSAAPAFTMSPLQQSVFNQLAAGEFLASVIAQSPEHEPEIATFALTLIRMGYLQ